MPTHRADRPPSTGDRTAASAGDSRPAYVGNHRSRPEDGHPAPDRGRATSRRRRLGPTTVGAAVLVSTAAAAVVLLPRAPDSVVAASSAAGPTARPPARAAAVADARAVRTALAARREQAASRSLSRVGHVDVVKQARTATKATRERRARAAAKAARKRAARLAAARAEAARRARQWQLPVSPGAYHLTAGFGACSGLWSHCHTGLDFAAPSGTPIHAVATGSITETGYEGAYGNKTVETLPDGTELWYAHQTAYTVHVGEHVIAGEVIGSVGSTGNTTGPHVHLEVRPSPDHPIDPFAALVSHGLHP